MCRQTLFFKNRRINFRCARSLLPHVTAPPPVARGAGVAGLRRPGLGRASRAHVRLLVASPRASDTRDTFSRTSAPASRRTPPGKSGSPGLSPQKERLLPRGDLAEGRPAFPPGAGAGTLRGPAPRPLSPECRGPCVCVGCRAFKVGERPRMAAAGEGIHLGTPPPPCQPQGPQWPLTRLGKQKP